MQHVLRYHLLLDTMAASARRQIAAGRAEVGTEQAWVRDFYANLRGGLLAMADLNGFLNEYKRDSEILSDFQREGLHPERILLPYDCLPSDRDVSREFGELAFDAKLELKKSGEKKYKTRYLLAFQGTASHGSLRCTRHMPLSTAINVDFFFRLLVHLPHSVGGSGGDLQDFSVVQSSSDQGS